MQSSISEIKRLRALPPEGKKTAIRAAALSLGFSDLRVARVDEPWTAGEGLKAFVEQGWHGSMVWMEETLERRSHPNHMWPEAKTALMMGFNYGPDFDPRVILNHKDQAAISVYAQNEDYHDLIKKKLKALGTWLGRTFECELKVFVDTAPLMEKPLAAKAGLGWQGKHTNLVSREFGSWLFLGSILTTLELPFDVAEVNHCGSCSACLSACPTEAFVGSYRLDARKCISYLTIEHKDGWPEGLRAKMGNRIYGCDDCLAACPWNKFAKATQEIKLQTRDSLKDLPLSDLLDLEDESFRALFAKSPVKRIGVNRFLRNVLYAAGNSGDKSLQIKVAHHLNSADPVVKDAAQWAMDRLSKDVI